MPVSSASAACARRCRHSPCTGIRYRGLATLSRVRSSPGRRVAGDVHPRGLLVHDGGAQPGQPVDHLVDGGLVARHQRRREDDGVAGGDGDLVVVAAGHPAERRQRLALRPGGHQHDLLGRHRGGLVQRHHQPGRDVQQAEVAGDAHVAHHRPADEGDLAPVRPGAVEHLLDAVHVAGEAGDDQPLRRPGEDVVQDRADAPLGGDEAGHLGVGRVRQQQVDAGQPQPGEGAEVGQDAVQRQLVHLEVAGVHERAGRGVHGDGERVGDRVVDRDELAVERPGDVVVAGRDLDQRRVDPVLAQLGRDQREGEPRPDQRDVLRACRSR